MTTRKRLESIEEQALASYATKSSHSLGRTLHGDELATVGEENSGRIGKNSGDIHDK